MYVCMYVYMFIHLSMCVYISMSISMCIYKSSMSESSQNGQNLPYLKGTLCDKLVALTMADHSRLYEKGPCLRGCQLWPIMADYGW